MAQGPAPPAGDEHPEKERQLKRGRRAEGLCDELLASLRKEGKIVKFLVAQRFSFLDFLYGIDRIVERHDGSFVPLGVSSSEDRRVLHEERYGRAHMRTYGVITPVVVIATKNRASLARLKHWLVCVIEGYKGTFTYDPWMLKYDEVLDVVKNPDLSVDQRVELFWRNRRKKSR